MQNRASRLLRDLAATPGSQGLINPTTRTRQTNRRGCAAPAPASAPASASASAPIGRRARRRVLPIFS